jgi:hypothetical protein
LHAPVSTKSPLMSSASTVLIHWLAGRTGIGRDWGLEDNGRSAASLYRRDQQ